MTTPAISAQYVGDTANSPDQRVPRLRVRHHHPKTRQLLQLLANRKRMKPHMIYAVQEQQILWIIVPVVTVDVVNVKSIPQPVLQPFRRSMRIGLKPC